MNFDLTKIFLAGLCVAASVEDLTHRKVSNQKIIIGFIFTLFLVLFTRGGSGLWLGLGGFCTVLGTGYGLWRFRVLGAGDVKLMAVVGLALPWQRGLEFMGYSLMWGGVMGLIVLLLNKTLFEQAKVLHFHPIMSIRSPEVRHEVRQQKIPFTIGIFLGILSMWILDSKGVYFL